MTDKHIIVNGIDITKCEHLRIGKDKEFYCKTSTYEYVCNPLTMECPMYVNHLKSIIQRLEKEKTELQIQFQAQQHESCHFDKIKELAKEQQC